MSSPDLEGGTLREQRFTFDEVAALYDRARTVCHPDDTGCRIWNPTFKAFAVSSANAMRSCPLRANAAFAGKNCVRAYLWIHTLAGAALLARFAAAIAVHLRVS